MQRAAISLILLWTLSAPSALAATTVLHGAGLDVVTAGTRAREFLGSTEFVVAGGVADQIGGPPGGLAIVGTAGRRCSGEAPDGRDLGAMLVPLRLQLLEMDYAGATRVLDDLTTRLPCRATSAGRSELWEIFFLKGLAAWNDGKKAEARAAFAQAAALDPAQPWPTSYPPTAKETYFEAIQAAVTTRSVQLRTDVDGVTLDGRTLSIGTPQTVYTGGHLVRRGGDAMWLTVAPGPETRPELLVTSADQLIEGLFTGNPSYRPWLVDLAATRGWGDILLVDSHRAAALRAGAFLTLAAERPPKTARDSGSRRLAPSGPTVTGLILLGSGVGLGGFGLGLHLDAWAKAAPPESGPLMPREEYESFVDRNRAGLLLAIAGAAVGGTGTVVTVVGSKKAKAFAGGPKIQPWIALGPGGAGAGLRLLTD